MERLTVVCDTFNSDATRLASQCLAEPDRESWSEIRFADRLAIGPRIWCAKIIDYEMGG